jgi:hypothetical protein
LKRLTLETYSYGAGSELWPGKLRQCPCVQIIGSPSSRICVSVHRPDPAYFSHPHMAPRNNVTFWHICWVCCLSPRSTACPRERTRSLSLVVTGSARCHCAISCSFRPSWLCDSPRDTTDDQSLRLMIRDPGNMHLTRERGKQYEVLQH